MENEKPNDGEKRAKKKIKFGELDESFAEKGADAR